MIKKILVQITSLFKKHPIYELKEVFTPTSSADISYSSRSSVEKKLKKRSIKTDNGFDIKADLTDFEDPMKYSVRQNPDGSIDIVIKNVRFYEEK